MKKTPLSLKIFSSPIISFFFIIASVQLLLSETYLKIAYQLPNVPEDKYGLSLEGRLYISAICINYLEADTNAEILRNLLFSDNRKKVFTDSEIDHLFDVKVLIQGIISLWRIITVILIVSVSLSFLNKKLISPVLNLWASGSWFTISLLSIIFLFSFTDFNLFFIQFHSIFFVGDTWIFPENSTLIRLFPIEFWQNALSTIGIISLAFCVITITIVNGYNFYVTKAVNNEIGLKKEESDINNFDKPKNKTKKTTSNKKTISKRKIKRNDYE